MRCIVVSGRGKAFVPDQNLKEALALGKDAEEERIIQRMVIDYYNPMVKSIVKNSKPVIALVNGPAVGAGALCWGLSVILHWLQKVLIFTSICEYRTDSDTARNFYYLPKLLQTVGRLFSILPKETFIGRSETVGINS